MKKIFLSLVLFGALTVGTVTNATEVECLTQLKSAPRDD